MKESFKEGVWVRFKLKDGSSGALARITEPKVRYNQPGWKVRGYMGEGFYHITTILDQRNLIVCEDDLILVDRGVVNGIPIGVGTEDLIRNNGLPADDQEREDAARLMRVATDHGKFWPMHAALKKWEDVSEDCGAGWMLMPESDEDLWRWITDMKMRKGVT